MNYDNWKINISECMVNVQVSEFCMPHRDTRLLVYSCAGNCRHLSFAWDGTLDNLVYNANKFYAEHEAFPWTLSLNKDDAKVLHTLYCAPVTCVEGSDSWWEKREIEKINSDEEKDNTYMCGLRSGKTLLAEQSLYERLRVTNSGFDKWLTPEAFFTCFNQYSGIDPIVHLETYNEWVNLNNGLEINIKSFVGDNPDEIRYSVKLRATKDKSEEPASKGVPQEYGKDYFNNRSVEEIRKEASDIWKDKGNWNYTELSPTTQDPADPIGRIIKKGLKRHPDDHYKERHMQLGDYVVHVDPCLPRYKDSLKAGFTIGFIDDGCISEIYCANISAIKLHIEQHKTDTIKVTAKCMEYLYDHFQEEFDNNGCKDGWIIDAEYKECEEEPDIMVYGYNFKVEQCYHPSIETDKYFTLTLANYDHMSLIKKDFYWDGKHIQIAEFINTFVAAFAVSPNVICLSKKGLQHLKHVNNFTTFTPQYPLARISVPLCDAGRINNPHGIVLADIEQDDGINSPYGSKLSDIELDDDQDCENEGKKTTTNPHGITLAEIIQNNDQASIKIPIPVKDRSKPNQNGDYYPIGSSSGITYMPQAPKQDSPSNPNECPTCGGKMEDRDWGVMIGKVCPKCDK